MGMSNKCAAIAVLALAFFAYPARADQSHVWNLRLIKGNGEDAGVIHGVTAAQCERGKAMIEQDWASREKRSPQELKTAECARAGE